MISSNFWRHRFFFFITIWIFAMIIVGLTIVVVTGTTNAAFWEAMLNIGIRAFFLFGIYILLFSYVVNRLAHYIPYSSNRFLLRFLLNVVIGVSVAYVSSVINVLFPFPTIFQASQNNFSLVFVISLFHVIAIFTALDIWNIIDTNRDLKLSVAQFEKEKVQSQLQALRNQINPHFLFNSLSVLSELMHDDLQKADLFIDYFAKVYRYVLEINQEILVPLAKEVEFLNAYIFLQKIRFGDSLQVAIQIPPTDLPQYLPPLSLQILFENAIKHNRISTAMPLTVEIGVENNRLYMTNNVQQMNTEKPAESTGIGLKNLASKYALISDKTPDFYLKDGQYIAELPLIQPAI
ncbi:MAG: histidine kinase [Bacteroidota bacterium]